MPSHCNAVAASHSLLVVTHCVGGAALRTRRRSCTRLGDRTGGLNEQRSMLTAEQQRGDSLPQMLMAAGPVMDLGRRVLGCSIRTTERQTSMVERCARWCIIILIAATTLTQPRDHPSDPDGRDAAPCLHQAWSMGDPFRGPIPKPRFRRLLRPARASLICGPSSAPISKGSQALKHRTGLSACQRLLQRFPNVRRGRRRWFGR